MKRSLTVLFILMANLCLGQKISNVDFSQMEAVVKDSFSIYYYPFLLERFAKDDSTLTEEEYTHLYYGNVFYEKYNPYGISEKEKEFRNFYELENFSSALEFGLKVVEENPINLDVLYKIAVCYNALDNNQKMRAYARKYFSLLRVIYYSGDGKGVSTAFVVIKINDEYQLLSDSKLNSKGQSLLISGPTDRLIIETKGQSKQKGEKKIKELYFNVSMPLGHMNKKIKSNE